MCPAKQSPARRSPMEDCPHCAILHWAPPCRTLLCRAHQFVHTCRIDFLVPWLTGLRFPQYLRVGPRAVQQIGGQRLCTVGQLANGLWSVDFGDGELLPQRHDGADGSRDGRLCQLSHAYFGSKLATAKRYPSRPKPQITPLQFFARYEWWRNGSRAYTLEIWTSTTGAVTAAMASRRANDVCV